MGEIAKERGHWAGLPIPLPDTNLVVEPTFPGAEAISDCFRKPPDPDDEGWKLRNSWHSRRYRCTIMIMEDPNGKIVLGKLPAFHSIGHSLGVLGVTEAWGIEQEGAAIQLLAGMLRHRAFKHYLLTGMFLEKSERSGVTYVFRRLKPTIALAPGRRPEDSMRILASLCMHPIAYYEGTWAGAMVPTDDVIAHLALMRGDEAMFWRRCNQHAPHLPEAGI